MKDPYHGLSEVDRATVIAIATAMGCGPLLPHNITHPLMARRVFEALRRSGAMAV
ncbi:hypothetical protein [Brevundimonas sp. Root1279]|uniref:hypothetical protein n=1 Tax=Brevundimonas sp. Root1279 TaxID=1736443 RepID=UPI000A931812|nr:hypothetical protein [Brevundimonas sp. Root1279]